MGWVKTKAIRKEVRYGGYRSVVDISAHIESALKESTDEIEHILWYPIIDDIYQKVIGHTAYKKQNGLIYFNNIWK
tara:strand:- start:136 stop:363 length:228 start_codon:yes stop_codon:yes gene_type:complete